MMYLVEGKEKAALIDTGSGVGRLRPTIERLTDKPVIVILTHGHVDHAMGAGEFENVFLCKEDAYIYADHCDPQLRREGLEMVTPPWSATEEDLMQAADIDSFHDLHDGDRFELGGISLELFACPGHTRGTMMVLIPEERILVTGDACNDITFLYDYYSTTVAAYETALRRLLPRVKGKYDRVLFFHGTGEGDPTVIEDMITICRDIRENETLRIFLLPFAEKRPALSPNPERMEGQTLYTEKSESRGQSADSKSESRRQIRRLTF